MNYIYTYLFAEYVDILKSLVFNSPLETLKATMAKHEAEVPAPLTSQFTERANRSDAIKTWESRRMKATELYPAGQ